MPVTSYLNPPNKFIEIGSFSGTDIVDDNYTVESRLLEMGEKDIYAILIGKGPNQDLRTSETDDLDIMVGVSPSRLGDPYDYGMIIHHDFSFLVRNWPKTDEVSKTITFHSFHQLPRLVEYEFRYILSPDPVVNFADNIDFSGMVTNFKNDEPSENVNSVINKLNYLRTNAVELKDCSRPLFVPGVEIEDRTKYHHVIRSKNKIGDSLIDFNKSFVFLQFINKIYRTNGSTTQNLDGFLIRWPGWLDPIRTFETDSVAAFWVWSIDELWPYSIKGQPENIELRKRSDGGINIYHIDGISSNISWECHGAGVIPLIIYDPEVPTHE